MSAISIQLLHGGSLVRFASEQLRDRELLPVDFDDAQGLPLSARTLETDCQLELYW